MKDFFSNLFSGTTTDIYSRKSKWKWYLAVIGLIIVVFTVIYTNYLVKQLREQEVRRIENYRTAAKVFTTEDGEVINSLPENIISFIAGFTTDTTSGIPIIWTDERYNINDIRGFSDEIDATGFQMTRDSAFAYKKLNELISQNREPVLMRDDNNMIIGKIYYTDSKILTLLKYYPILQFILITLFIGFGYLGFSSSRRNEQNRVWVGMAKETAHQLGTPIAAILGWIEHLRATHEDDEMTQEVVNELQHDVDRLTLVADRFSKIGSEPELIPTNIYEAIDRCRAYMQKRAPRKVVFNFPLLETPPQYIGVKINNHLFDWVVENLMRNAIDAMENGKGIISANIYEEPQWVCIDISDSGHGIPNNKFKTVFQPGFTTKKRGWGLGLSLAKRIIDNYHGGKIFVKESVIGKGTTFCIKLPKD
ncbi:MAG: HAMP domain-containing histidine kinase [Saprospiraceae bacterium]|nr:HAMP domain-containing histidine kinase [Saprospiraceae bacterium]